MIEICRPGWEELKTLYWRTLEPGDQTDLVEHDLFRASLAADTEGLRVGGRLMMAGGVQPIRGWPNRGAAWLLVAPDFPPRAWPVARGGILAHIERCHADGLRRIEAQVRADFPAGVRLARRLGFQIEGIARQMFPDGIDAFIYARVA